eukprot:SAG22_NODE_641_length_8235_cov_9.502704_3_plen_56_part_00
MGAYGVEEQITGMDKKHDVAAMVGSPKSSPKRKGAAGSPKAMKLDSKPVAAMENA